MLLIAFEKLLAKGYAISCALTVDSSDKKLLDKIFYLNKKYKAKIENFGVVPRKKVKSIYQNSKCLVFLSSKETFGLPLIEAASLGLDIIAPDLAYVHEVIEPSLVFEPNSADSLFKKLETLL